MILQLILRKDSMYIMKTIPAQIDNDSSCFPVTLKIKNFKAFILPNLVSWIIQENPLNTFEFSLSLHVLTALVEIGIHLIGVLWNTVFIYTAIILALIILLQPMNQSTISDPENDSLIDSRFDSNPEKKETTNRTGKQEPQSDCEEQENVSTASTDASLIQRYQQLFPNHNLQDTGLKQAFIRQLESEKIFYLKRQSEEMEIKTMHCSENKEVLCIRVDYGHFRQCLTVLNVMGSNCFYGLPRKIASHTRTSDTISLFYQKYKVSLISKRFLYQKLQNFKQKFYNAVQQFFLLKIASVLQTGPHIHNYFGFDLLVFQDSIEFCMENCFTPQDLIQIRRKKSKHPQLHMQEELLKQSLSSDLRKALLVNHLFKLIHFDIKLPNVAFSLHFKKHVFIDYGFSKIIKEPLGVRTLTSFIGTPYIASPEMQNSLNASFEKHLVDLYYNDAYCLEMTLKELSHLQKQLDRPFFQKQQSINCFETYALYSIQHKLYFGINSDKETVFTNIQAIVQLLMQLPMMSSQDICKKRALPNQTQLNHSFLSIKYFQMFLVNHPTPTQFIKQKLGLTEIYYNSLKNQIFNEARKQQQTQFNLRFNALEITNLEYFQDENRMKTTPQKNNNKLEVTGNMANLSSIKQQNQDEGGNETEELRVPLQYSLLKLSKKINITRSDLPLNHRKILCESFLLKHNQKLPTSALKALEKTCLLIYQLCKSSKVFGGQETNLYSGASKEILQQLNSTNDCVSILAQIFPTIVLLQLKSQKELSQDMTNFLNHSVSLKMSAQLVGCFLQSIGWIKNKLKTKYSFLLLQQIVLKHLIKNTDCSMTDNTNQEIYTLLFKEIVFAKLKLHQMETRQIQQWHKQFITKISKQLYLTDDVNFSSIFSLLGVIHFTTWSIMITDYSNSYCKCLLIYMISLSSKVNIEDPLAELYHFYPPLLVFYLQSHQQAPWKRLYLQLQRFFKQFSFFQQLAAYSRVNLMIESSYIKYVKQRDVIDYKLKQMQCFLERIELVLNSANQTKEKIMLYSHLIKKLADLQYPENMFQYKLQRKMLGKSFADLLLKNVKTEQRNQLKNIFNQPTYQTHDLKRIISDLSYTYKILLTDFATVETTISNIGQLVMNETCMRCKSEASKNVTLIAYKYILQKQPKKAFDLYHQKCLAIKNQPQSSEQLFEILAVIFKLCIMKDELVSQSQLIFNEIEPFLFNDKYKNFLFFNPDIFAETALFYHQRGNRENMVKLSSNLLQVIKNYPYFLFQLQKMFFELSKRVTQKKNIDPNDFWNWQISVCVIIQQPFVKVKKLFKKEILDFNLLLNEHYFEKIAIKYYKKNKSFKEKHQYLDKNIYAAVYIYLSLFYHQSERNKSQLYSFQQSQKNQFAQKVKLFKVVPFSLSHLPSQLKYYIFKNYFLLFQYYLRPKNKKSTQLVRWHQKYISKIAFKDFLENYLGQSKIRNKLIKKTFQNRLRNYHRIIFGSHN